MTGRVHNVVDAAIKKLKGRPKKSPEESKNKN